jgi:hypothetical protein
MCGASSVTSRSVTIPTSLLKKLDVPGAFVKNPQQNLRKTIEAGF